MLNVLINSYACCPGMGSEQGMGWNWIIAIAKQCNCFVITESEYHEKIASWLDFPGNNDLAQHMHFFFIDIGDTAEESVRIRQMCWNQGTWAFYPKYAKWQKKVLDGAKDIIDQQEIIGQEIDIMHQLNMAGFREPGMLYKINEERERNAKKHIPLVWGPMTGYGSIPFSFMIPGGLKFTTFYCIKNALNYLQLIGHQRVRKMIKEADCLIAATPEMQYGIKSFYGIDAEHINETGIYTNESSLEKKVDVVKDTTRIKILWVGRFIYTKQLELAIDTMSHFSDNKTVEFHIVGKAFSDNETELMHKRAIEAGIEHLCHWHGQIPNNEVHRLMQECDLFFFTSIFEATSTVILEAIQNRLPIVCFDRCGFGPIVNDSVAPTPVDPTDLKYEFSNAAGVKIPCKSPKQAIQDFSCVITYLINHRDKLDIMVKNCYKKQTNLTWDIKSERLIGIYNKLIEKTESNRCSN